MMKKEKNSFKYKKTYKEEYKEGNNYQTKDLKILGFVNGEPI